VGADDENKIRSPELGWKLDHEVNHRLMPRVAQDWKGSPTMAEVNDLVLILKAIWVHHKNLLGVTPARLVSL
jgi:hypothetical protein